MFICLTKVSDIYVDYISQARQVHNLKVVGLSPAPTNNLLNKIINLNSSQRLRFLADFSFKDSKLVKSD